MLRQAQRSMICRVAERSLAMRVFALFARYIRLCREICAHTAVQPYPCPGPNCKGVPQTIWMASRTRQSGNSTPGTTQCSAKMHSDLHHNPRGRQAVVVSATFTALAFIIVSLRLYTRFFLVRCPGVEDYGVTLAMVSIQQGLPPT
jgi:hypothetical protein